MSGARYSEDVFVQRKMAAFLRDELGWETALAWNEEQFGPEGAFGRHSDKEIILTRYLERALRRLNPGLPDNVYAAAIDQITRAGSGQTLLKINRRKYKLLRQGVQVDNPTADNPDETVRLRVFDFDNPAQNDFLAWFN